MKYIHGYSGREKFKDVLNRKYAFYLILQNVCEEI